MYGEFPPLSTIVSDTAFVAVSMTDTPPPLLATYPSTRPAGAAEAGVTTSAAVTAAAVTSGRNRMFNASWRASSRPGQDIAAEWPDVSLFSNQCPAYFASL